MVCSHLGRPVRTKPEQSLAPVAAYLTQALGQDVKLLTDYLDGVEVAPRSGCIAGKLVLTRTCSRTLRCVCNGCIWRVHINKAFCRVAAAFS